MHEQRDLFELWMVLYITQEFVVDTAKNGSWTEIRPAASPNPGFSDRRCTGGQLTPHRAGSTATTVLAERQQPLVSRQGFGIIRNSEVAHNF